MKRAHITILPRILEALEALSEINGQSVSSLITEACRDYLRARNLLPEVTPEMVAEQMRLHNTKQRPTAAEITKAKKRLPRNANPQPKAPARV